MASKETRNETSEEFSSRINNALSSGFLCVGLAVGSATGLFEAMARFGEPKTSNQIAREANKKERYVREWLASMVTGRIVDYFPEEDTYFLPPARLRLLNNVCAMAQLLPTICEAYSHVLQCMEPDGPRGVPDSVYTPFHHVATALAKTKFSHGVPDFIRNMDTVMAKLGSGITVCDMGCGTGTLILELAKAFPMSTFCGFDFAEDAIGTAQKTAKELGLINLTYHCYDSAKLPADWSDKFELVLSTDSLHDHARPDLSLKECHRILKTDGYLIIVEADSHTKLNDNLDNPKANTMYTCSLMHCIPVSLYFDGGLGYGNMLGMEKVISLVENAQFVCERHFKLGGTSERVFLCKKMSQ